MNLTFLLLSVLLFGLCKSNCGWCKQPQIQCLKKEHSNHGMEWKSALAKGSQKYADAANEKHSSVFKEVESTDIGVNTTPLRVCYTRLAGNFVETCSQYMIMRIEKILRFKNKGAKFGCALTHNEDWISVCCLYKLPKE